MDKDKLSLALRSRGCGDMRLRQAYKRQSKVRQEKTKEKNKNQVDKQQNKDKLFPGNSNNRGGKGEQLSQA